MPSNITDNVINSIKTFSKINPIFLFLSFSHNPDKVIRYIIAAVHFAFDYEIQEYIDRMAYYQGLRNKGRVVPDIKKLLEVEKYDDKIEALSDGHSEKSDSNSSYTISVMRDDHSGDGEDDERKIQALIAMKQSQEEDTVSRPRMKNEGENEFNFSFLELIKYKDVLSDMIESDIRKVRNNNPYICEWIFNNIIYNPVMLCKYTFKEKRSGKISIHTYYLYQIIMELIYTLNVRYRTYYLDLYKIITEVENIERLTQYEPKKQDMENKYNDENNKDAWNYKVLDAKVRKLIQNGLTKKVIYAKDVAFLETIQITNAIQKAEFLFEEFKHSMEYILYDFKKFYIKNHTNLDLFFSYEKNLKKVKTYLKKYYFDKAMWKSSEHCFLKCTIVSKNPKTLARAVTYWFGFIKSHAKYFDHYEIQNGFKTYSKDYTELIIKGIYIYKGMTSSFIISFTLKEMLVLRKCFERNQQIYRYFRTYCDRITDNLNRLYIKESSKAIYSGFQPVFSNAGKYLTLSICDSPDTLSSYKVLLYNSHNLSDCILTVNKAICRCIMYDYAHITNYNKDNEITDDYIVNIRTKSKIQVLRDKVLYTMKNYLLYYTNQAAEIRRKGFAFWIYRMDHSLVESHTTPLLSHNIGDFFKNIYLLVPFYHKGDRKIRIYDTDEKSTAEKFIQIKSTKELENYGSSKIFAHGTKCLVLQTFEEEVDYLSVYDLSNLGVKGQCNEIRRVYLAKDTGYWMTNDWLFYVGFDKLHPEVTHLKIMELCNHNKKNNIKFKYDLTYDSYNVHNLYGDDKEKRIKHVPGRTNKDMVHEFQDEDSESDENEDIEVRAEKQRLLKEKQDQITKARKEKVKNIRRESMKLDDTLELLTVNTKNRKSSQDLNPVEDHEENVKLTENEIKDFFGAEMTLEKDNDELEELSKAKVKNDPNNVDLEIKVDDGVGNKDAENEEGGEKKKLLSSVNLKRFSNLKNMIKTNVKTNLTNNQNKYRETVLIVRYQFEFKDKIRCVSVDENMSKMALEFDGEYEIDNKTVYKNYIKIYDIY